MCSQVHRSRISHVFKDTLARVYHCFTNFPLVKQFIARSYKCQIDVEAGDGFDDPNANIFININNTYQWRSYVINVIKSEHYCSYTRISMGIQSISSKTTAYNSFYYNTIENETLFVIEKVFEDPVSQLFLGVDLQDESIQMTFKQIEQHLDMTRSKIEQIETIMVYHSIEKLWNTISHYEWLDRYLFRSTKSRYKEKKEEIRGGEKLMVPLEREGKEVSVFIRSIKKRHKKLRMIMEIQKKEHSIPKQMMRLFIDKINDNACMISLIHYALEPISHLSLCIIKGYKKDILNCFKNMK